MQKHFSNLSMIIDDEDLSSFIMQQLLIQAQFCKRSIIMPSGFSALDYFENAIKRGQDLPDLVFLDINMPLVDGFDFIERFGKYPQHIVAKTKICMISSAFKTKSVEKLLADRIIVEFFQKPVNVDNFKQLRRYFV